MLTVTDEVLSESIPSFKITNNVTGEVLFESVSIELITEILQNGTPLTKALFDSIAKDFDNIADGTTVVGKAQKDASGNDISTTYVKESELSDVAKTGDYNDLENKPSLTVDTTLNKESNNAIANSTVATSIEQINETLSGKQETLTIDATPTAGSTNPVSSGGVYAMIGNLETILSQI